MAVLRYDVSGTAAIKHARAEKLKEGQALPDKKDLEGHKALMAEISGMNAEIEAAEKQLELERTYGESEPSRQAQKVYSPGQEGEGQDGYRRLTIEEIKNA